MVNEGDFILSNSMSFGRPYIMRTSGCIHDGWLVLSDYSASLEQDYLYYVLGSQLVFRQFDRLAAGSTVRNLNIDLASRVVLPVPPLDIQRAIVQEVEALAEETQRLTRVYERKLAALDELKKTLLHKAFSGEL
jgi:type I restriction enzyme S subunit